MKNRKKSPGHKVTSHKVLITGNEAIAEAAVQAGCFFYAGYPITPQNEIPAYMASRMNEEKRVFIQAESEVAAINMVFGASCTGKRAMTSSSSPGISLKQEGLSYLAGCRLPAVIVNVMRAGPGLGGIGPGQADYFQATRGGGHGDYRSIVLAPSSVQESFDLTMLAFDLADTYRSTVLILTDAFLGQMAEPITVKTKSQGYKVTRSQVEKAWALTGAKNRAPNIIRSFFLSNKDLEAWNLDLQKVYRKIEENEIRFEAKDTEDAEIIFVAYGISFRIAREASLNLRRQGLKVGIFRPVTLWPYPYQALKKSCTGKKAVFVFELSYGQMVEDVLLSVGEKLPVHFYGRAGGGVFGAEELVNFVKEKLKR